MGSERLRTRVWTLGLVVGVLGLPAPAGAATVTVGEVAPGVQGVVYTAAAGEANQLTITATSDRSTVTLTDAGAVVTPTGRCRSVDPHTAVCGQPPDFLNVTRADLGDGDDRLSGAVEAIRASGGPGNDVLETGDGIDQLHGGGGTDTLRGGGGDDLLSDDDNDGAADADVLDGGAGTFDTVSYDNRRDGVAVDLEAAGEDTLSGFEVVVGGAGDDRLAGGEQTDRLVGGAGDDVLEGRGGGSSVDDEEDEQLGNEELVGGAGDDQLDGGDGADTLDGGAGRDRFTCGAGRDIVLAPETDEFLTAACESLRVQGTPPRGSFGVMVFPPVPHAVAGGTVRHFLACPRVEALDDAVVRCRGKLTLREAGGRRRLLGRAPFADRRHRPRFRVDVALTRLGRRLARAGVDVTATARGPRVPTAAWSYRLEV